MAGANGRRRTAAPTTTRPSRRAKAAVNYAEPDSDAPQELNHFDDEELTQSDPEIESEGEYAAPGARRKRKSPAKPLRQAPAKKRRAAPAAASRPRRREFSSDVDDSDSNTEDDLPMMNRAMQKKPAPRTARGARRRAASTPPKEVVKKPQPWKDIHSEEKNPPWNTLPYHVLLNIFSFVAGPLIDERTFQATPNFRSVLNASKVCRAWSEPGKTVLWQDPVLVPMERAHMLADALKLDPSTTAYNYRQKVQHISLDVFQSAEYTLTGQGRLDVPDLVYHCPRLSTLEICHAKDLPPYRGLDESVKWSYPPELFDALDQNISGRATELKSWRWSSRLVSKAPISGGYDFTLLNTVHIKPSFQSLTKLAFVNYQTPDLPRKIPAGFVPPQTEKNLCDTIALLPNLRHLIFEACGIVNGTLLPLLPRNLHTLEITACGELLSDDLGEFLLTHGSQLTSLVLNHNQALSLSFLTILGAACPKLEDLRCNLAYYNLHGTYKDNEPTFKELLSIAEIPTWPSTLRTLQLTQLRKWEAKAAENLFSSLLDSAGELKDLRTLVVKAILDSISWRDRGGFRDRWMKSFEHVFKRKSTPPAPYLSSMGHHQWYQTTQARLAGTLDEPVVIDSDYDVLESRITGHRIYRKRPTVATDSKRDGPGKRQRKVGKTGVEILPTPSREEPVVVDSDSDTLESGMTGHRIYRKRPTVETDSDSERPLKRQRKKEKPRPRVEIPPTPSLEGPPRSAGVKSKEVEWLQASEKIAGATRERGSSYDSLFDSDAAPLSKRKTRRPKTNKPKKNVEVRIDGRSVTTPGGTRYGGDVDTSFHSEDSLKGQVVQGLCDVVVLRIDNLRPTENQFTEADFLDSEPDEDGEWEGEGGDGNGWVW